MAAIAVNAPASARALGPLPACRYDDILTSPRGYDDWTVTLVDTILMVPRTYVPPDLVAVSTAGIEGSGKVRAILVEDLREMAEAAAAAGTPIGVQSAYRSYEQQRETFQGWVDQLGRDKALRVSARPGHSEHQLGLAIDFRSAAGGSPFEGDWGETPAGMWMAANAWQYGFVMSYPRRSRSVTCYDYESWHFRYLGRELAADVHASGLTIREYLWANFTTAIVPPPSGQPLPTFAPTPQPSSSSAASPSGEPTAQPSPSPTPSPATSATPSAPASEPPTPAPSPPVTSPSGALDPYTATAGVVILVAIVALVAFLLRRGRSGAVLTG